MTTQQLQLDIDAFLGFTEWQSGPPPCEGWWAVRRVGDDEEKNEDRRIRRYWDGERWSACVLPGTSEQETEGFRRMKIGTASKWWEWSGLREDPLRWEVRRAPTRQRIKAKKPRVRLMIPGLAK